MAIADLIAPEIADLPDPQEDEYGNVLEAHVSLRRGTEIQGNCRVGAYSSINGATIYPRTTIGRYCSIARGAAIGAPDHPLDCLGTSLALTKAKAVLQLKETFLGSDVWVGANVVVLGGVSVGHGAVIGAGAVVTKNVEPYAVIVGVPARLVRHRFPPEIVADLLALRWWELDHDVVDALPHDDVKECIHVLKVIRRDGVLPA